MGTPKGEERGSRGESKSNLSEEGVADFKIHPVALGLLACHKDHPD